MQEQTDPGRRVYARPQPDEDPKAFTQRFLAMIQAAAGAAERDEDRNSN